MDEDAIRRADLKRNYPDFWKVLGEELRESGPGRLRERKTLLEDRVERLKKKLSRQTPKARKAVLKTFLHFYPDVDESKLEQVADLVAKGGSWDAYGREDVEGDPPSYEDALDAATKKHGTRDIRRLYTAEVEDANRLRSELRTARDKLHIMGFVLDDWAMGEMDAEVGNGSDQERDDEKLRRILTDDSRRLEWIEEELMSRGDTWKERFEVLKSECERVGITVPYSGHDSLRTACDHYVDRKS